MASHSILSEIIRSEIEERGPIPFRRFMELALYHPEHGYYAGGKNRTGKDGDFITNVSVGSFFGRLLAHYIVKAWEELEKPESFDLVEIGANNGQLHADVLHAIEELEPRLFSSLRCQIIEPFPRAKMTQEQFLEKEGFRSKIQWFSNLQEIPSDSIHGVIWSNELFDALPVHRLKKLKSGWAEVYVANSLEGFCWSTGNTTYDPIDIPAGFPASSDLPENYTTELWPHAEFWAGELSRILAQGKILTIDYGYEAGEYYAEHRKNGTLQACHQHQRSSNLLNKIGEQDITAHVNFTALIEAGKKYGLETQSFVTQERFLMGIVKGMLPEDFSRMSDKEKKQFNMLIHPDILGNVFKVLIQIKA